MTSFPPSTTLTLDLGRVIARLPSSTALTLPPPPPLFTIQGRPLLITPPPCFLFCVLFASYSLCFLPGRMLYYGVAVFVETLFYGCCFCFVAHYCILEDIFLHVERMLNHRSKVISLQRFCIFGTSL